MAAPLPVKLGVKPGARVHVRGAPDGFELAPLPDGVSLLGRARAPLDVALLFLTRRADLERSFGGLQRALDRAGALWIAWPKKASGRATDLNEHVVREYALGHGRVDVKVCAVDDTWTGFKHVIRKADR